MNKIADLAMRMRAKRESGSHPYVLVLGAGASVSSGTSLNRAVVERVLGTYDLKAFDEYLSQCSNDERFAILRELVEGTGDRGGHAVMQEVREARKPQPLPRVESLLRAVREHQAWRRALVRERWQPFKRDDEPR